MISVYITLGVYLLAMLGLGYLFSSYNKNTSDYVRGGAQAKWWMVGASSVMTNISAFTFTGNAWAAFESGPTLLIIFAANCTVYLIFAIFLAAWFRQTRAYTFMDVVKERFGVKAEQFATYTGLIMSPFGAAIQLWAVAVFASSVFKIPIHYSIICIGTVVVLYSTMGGKWGVMATDFAQSIILYSITIIMAFLSIRAIGGLDSFLSYFHHPEFSSDFSFVNEAGQFPDNRFSLKWIIVIFILQISGPLGLQGSNQFLAARDGGEARKAAFFGLFLMMIGSLIWFIPPWVARFLYEDEVRNLLINDPENAAYAFMAIKLLPTGLMGIMLAAIISATMSSMDTGINGQTGIIIRNLLPPLRKILGAKEPNQKQQVRTCRLINLALGAMIISLSLALSSQNKFKLFDAYFVLASIIFFPIGIPLIIGIWTKRIPSWGYFFIIGFSLIPSAWTIIDESFYGNHWTIQDRLIAVGLTGLVAFLLSSIFYKSSSPQYLRNVDTFFLKMRTPITEDETEIGNTVPQAKIMGYASIFMGFSILFLLFLTDTNSGRYCVFFTAGFVVFIGLLLLFGAWYEMRKIREIQLPKESLTNTTR